LLEDAGLKVENQGVDAHSALLNAVEALQAAVTPAARAAALGARFDVGSVVTYMAVNIALGNPEAARADGCFFANATDGGRIGFVAGHMALSFAGGPATNIGLRGVWLLLTRKIIFMHS
jgi:hypothetical protein